MKVKLGGHVYDFRSHLVVKRSLGSLVRAQIAVTKKTRIPLLKRMTRILKMGGPHCLLLKRWTKQKKHKKNLKKVSHFTKLLMCLIVDSFILFGICYSCHTVVLMKYV